MTNRSQMSRSATRSHPDRTRQRLPAAERERRIVEAAASFFAEYGLGGQTRELAKTMGITHSAIFRYFPSKEALIERVYEHVFVRRWDPTWTALITDRSRPFEDRIVRFYLEYADRIFDAQWMRIFMFAGLRGHAMTGRYVSLVRNQLIKPACGELRAELGLPTLASVPLTAREEEAFWALHGTVFYLGIRKFIYGVRTHRDQAQTIRDDVQIFLAGVPSVAREACASLG